MTLASMVRYYREQECAGIECTTEVIPTSHGLLFRVEQPHYQVIPPTIRGIADTASLCRCGACICCKMARYVARIDRIVLKTDFNINSK